MRFGVGVITLFDVYTCHRLVPQIKRVSSKSIHLESGRRVDVPSLVGDVGGEAGT